ncbi:MAG: inositol monophosphatase family protein [Gammaproteobacteria bacterium]|nr:inositol monophosphatase family protein [Gammaproteobacteria bacterium]
MIFLPDRCEVVDLVVQISRSTFDRSVPGKAASIKHDGSIVTEIDMSIQRNLKQKLEECWPQFGFVGEEMHYDEQDAVIRHAKEGYWVLDPLDGTTNFASGFLFYGVSLSLVIDGRAELAVTFDPIRNECFSAARNQGAYLNGHRLSCIVDTPLSDCVANIDYKRLTEDLSAQLVRCPPYRSQRNLGSSVLEWCWLAAGRFQLYLHGGQKLWDFAAGYLILLESGGQATSLSGQPLDCGKLRKRAIVAAINDKLLGQWQSWINGHLEVASGDLYRSG